VTPAERSFAEEPFRGLLELVAARTPTPGGGSVAALAGAMGASLGCMAIRFSMKRKDAAPDQDSVLASLERGLLDAVQRLTALADEDAASYEAVRAARKLPQTTDAERAAREGSVSKASDAAAEVPLRTARVCREAMELLDGSLAALNPNLATDAASGAVLLRSGVRCAAWNVLVNLVGNSSPAAVARRQEVEQLLARSVELESRASADCERALSR
jgi:formiminotetrahydrofolate cyclodeaminase